MGMPRRKLMRWMAGAAAALVAPQRSAALANVRIKAVVFDAFPVLDPRPVFALAEQLFPGNGKSLGEAWRTRLFEYQWLRALSGRYADFLQAADGALVFAAKAQKLDLTAEKRTRLVQSWLALKAWPDAPAALHALKEDGLRLAFLSNATPQMLEAAIRNSSLQGLFEQAISTDRIRSYKPDPRAYQLGVEALGLPAREILFAAFAGWDASGAKWFGYPTFWVNRAGAPAEELGAPPDGDGPGMDDLVRFVRSRR